jgi:ABC-type nitrate/sulfonate/bicarbonate transport system substrate-binding protein
MKKCLRSALGVGAAIIAFWFQSASAQEPLPELVVSSFPSPTASFWFSHLIPKLGLDRKHGFRLNVQAKPSQVAYSDFVSGASKACYCIATAAAARFVERGADISQVWIVQTNVSYLVTADPTVKGAKDLEGKTLAADTATGAWAIAASLISRAGADLKKIKVQPGAISNSLIELSRGRVDAAVATSALDFIRINQEEPNKYHLIVLGNDKATVEATGG